PPDPGVHRAGERADAADGRRRQADRRPGRARPRPAGAGGPGRPGAPQARRTLRRPAAARGRRPRAGHPAGPAAGRRAHRQPGQQVRRRGVRPVPPVQRAVRLRRAAGDPRRAHVRAVRPDGDAGGWADRERYGESGPGGADIGRASRSIESRQRGSDMSSADGVAAARPDGMFKRAVLNLRAQRDFARNHWLASVFYSAAIVVGGWVLGDLYNAWKPWHDNTDAQLQQLREEQAAAFKDLDGKLGSLTRSVDADGREALRDVEGLVQDIRDTNTRLLQQLVLAREE